MDERIQKLASIANLTVYDAAQARRYIDGAPHVKHRSLRFFYAGLVLKVFEHAQRFTDSPRVLDLGAGEGSVTLPFLELGAHVTAVDISSDQLEMLRRRCEDHADRLTVICEDVQTALKNASGTHDIVVANSFLHHIPDYIALIKDATALLTPNGQFFSFQDPLRYDSVGRSTRIFGDVAYLSWRVFKGDVIGGIGRRLRRRRGVYLEDSAADHAEYHVVRGGVDQLAIKTLLEDQGFECEIITYFSTQSRLFQLLGRRLGIKNTFAVLARRPQQAQGHQGDRI